MKTRRMADLGLTYIRIGEFAWSRLLPSRKNTISIGWTGTPLMGELALASSGVAVTPVSRAGNWR